jgi:hypothetical protein
MLGTEHNFKINAKPFVLHADYKPSNKRGLELNLTENNILIESKTVTLDNKQRLFWIVS